MPPRQLTLVRHAKSSWGDQHVADFDRPLNPRGERNLKLMAETLASEGFRPDRIISSPALRAITTARGFAAAVGIPEADVVEVAAIYEASPSHLVSLIRETPDSVNHLAVFGHNPGLESLSNALLYRDAIDRLVTCGVVEMHLLVDSWSSIDHDVAELVRYRFPKGIE